jgi:hypothetical protein
MSSHEGIFVNVEKPVFIVGAGRSGSTIFHRIFSEHPNVAWLSSRLCNRFPRKPWVNRWLMRTVDYPVIGEFLRQRFKTGEGYDLWDYYYRGFSTPFRDLLPEDVTVGVKERIPCVMSQILTAKRNRLLIKITGWPRVGFLHEIFPDAKFIHMKRDSRAVINSLIDIHWWQGWKGPQSWGMAGLTPAQRAEWEGFNQSFIALAGIYLQILTQAMQTARQYVDDAHFMEVNYADLCSNPQDVFKRALEFCELEWPPGFEKALKKHPLKNADYKWRQELTPEQQRIAEYFANGTH